VHSTRVIAIGNIRIRVCLAAAHTGGRLELLEFTAPPGSPGPPMHIHRRADETFHVLDGVLHMFVGEEKIDAAAGATVHVPRGTPHRFAYPAPGAGAPAPTRFLTCISPALEFERYFEELAALVKESYPPDRTKMAALMARFDQEAPG
jgi:mannose-6-phosphate isomerase-like protein (cupin superfamily)